MTATDELRHMLDERGVEWTNPNSCLRDEMTSWVANGFDYDAFEGPDGTLVLTAAHRDDLTPAQAIAATLGNEGVGRSNDGVVALLAENAKLRKLVTDYFNAPCVECNPWDEDWQGCKHCDSGNCNLAVRALELGVEVDA